MILLSFEMSVLEFLLLFRGDVVQPDGVLLYLDVEIYPHPQGFNLMFLKGGLVPPKAGDQRGILNRRGNNM